MCLDAWAVIAWLTDEAPAAARVDAALDGDSVMSWINVGEAHAREVVTELRASLRLDPPTPQRVLEAAAIKARSRTSHAAASATATALAHGAVLLTGDPERSRPAATGAGRTCAGRPRPGRPSPDLD